MANGAMTGFYVVDDRGSTIVELILWIEDGLPSILEYAWDTDKSADGSSRASPRGQ